MASIRRPAPATRGSLAALAAAAACVPLLAHADSGIGFLIPTIPFAIVALVPAIFVEAPILGRILVVPFRRALWLSFSANVASTIAGAIVAIAIDLTLAALTGSAGAPPGSVFVIAALVPMFFLTWWIECAVVRRMQGPKSNAKRATLVANAVSYAAMAVVVALVLPAMPEDVFALRARVTHVYALTEPARTDAQRAFEATGRFPEKAVDVAGIKDAKSATIDANGRIEVTLAMPGVKDLDGKHVVAEPKIEGKKVAAWTCRSSDVPVKYLAASCR